MTGLLTVVSVSPHGSIATLDCVDDDGREVGIAAEPRMAYDIADALEAGELVEIEPEPWQIVYGQWR